MNWWRRAKANDLPPLIVGGVPRGPFKCPSCPFTSKDPEMTWNHMWGHPGVNRRRAA